jgi:hypothetical protein
MSGTSFAVQPTLPAQLTGVYPIVITKAGLSYTISYAAGVPGTVTRRQWLSAVAALYNGNTLFASINANANDPAFIQYYAGYGVAPGDVLALKTQTVFGLTAIQMSALFTYAATLTP